jgi:hypothetical protein
MLRELSLVVLMLAVAGCPAQTCTLDNTDFWRPNDHGTYNCPKDSCDAGACQLEVLVDGTWTRLGKARESRDVVDKMAGQPIPTGNEPPKTPPTWVRCGCY